MRRTQHMMSTPPPVRSFVSNRCHIHDHTHQSTDTATADAGTTSAAGSWRRSSGRHPRVDRSPDFGRNSPNKCPWVRDAAGPRPICRRLPTSDTAALRLSRTQTPAFSSAEWRHLLGCWCIPRSILSRRVPLHAEWTRSGVRGRSPHRATLRGSRTLKNTSPTSIVPCGVSDRFERHLFSESSKPTAVATHSSSPTEENTLSVDCCPLTHLSDTTQGDLYPSRQVRYRRSSVCAFVHGEFLKNCPLGGIPTC